MLKLIFERSYFTRNTSGEKFFFSKFLNPLFLTGWLYVTFDFFSDIYVYFLKNIVFTTLVNIKQKL